VIAVDRAFNTLIFFKDHSTLYFFDDSPFLQSHVRILQLLRDKVTHRSKSLSHHQKLVTHLKFSTGQFFIETFGKKIKYLTITIL
jgi:hypothetical protein